jgi:hypothetical protein
MTFWTDLKHGFDRFWNNTKEKGIRSSWHEVKNWVRHHGIIKKIYEGGKEALIGALPEAASVVAEIEAVGKKIDKYLESDEINELSKTLFEKVDEIGAALDRKNRFLE